MEAGRVIADRFEVERRIGGGGMGTVCRAIDRLSGTPVALKFMKESGGDLSERFARESRVLAEFAHPGVVRYVAHGSTPDGELYLAMEWLEGEDLSKRLARKGLTLDETIELGKRVAQVLAAAHARGIVHRDIKPSNVFLPDEVPASAKLLDFGIVRSRQLGTAVTAIGVRVGTMGYMAPEQARGDPNVDSRADVFALGCVLYECIAGKPAFDGEHEVSVLAKTLLEDPPRLSEVRPGVPLALEALIGRMMAKDPAARPADASLVVRELDDLGRLTGSAPPPQPYRRQAITDTERRLLAVILAGALDRYEPTDTSLPTVLLRTQRKEDELIRGTARDFGAMVERLANGTFVLTLVGRGAATDQAVHAARCALALRRSLPEEIPVALATGRGLLDERMPAGEVIDRAVHTLQTETTGPIVRLDDTTAGLLDGRFEVRAEGGRFQLVAEREAFTSGRTLLGKPSPFVGRAREMAFLEATYAECIEESAARAALLVGPAGSGKSRLLHELVVRLGDLDPAPEVWSARGDPILAGSPFQLLGSALRRAIGLRDGEPIAYHREKIRERVRASIDVSQAQRVTEFLGELLHCPFPDLDRPQLAAARADAILRGDQMRLAFEELVQASSRHRPIVLVLDDVQWGDLPSIKTLDAAMRNVPRSRLLVIASGRADLYEQFPRIWSERDVQELKLGPLGRKAGETLVKNAMPDLSAERVEQMVDRAQGNPFFLEELVRAHAEGKGDAVPETVLAMVQARLENVEEDARHILRAASVFGHVFWRSGVATLLGDTQRGTQVDEWLDELQRRELIIPRNPSRFPDEKELAFHQDVIHGAAYAMLTDRDRVVGHRLAAEWLENVGESDPAVLASHLEAGHEPARAIRYYKRAAKDSLGGNDLAAALARAERGVLCGAAGEDYAQLRLLQAEAHRWRGEFEAAGKRASEARGAFAPSSMLWFRAIGEEAAAAGQAGHLDALIALHALVSNVAPQEDAEDAATIACARIAMHLLQNGKMQEARSLLFTIAKEPPRGRRRSPVAAARAEQARAVEAQFEGDPAAFFHATRAAATFFDEAGDLRNAAMQHMNLGYASLQVGRLEEAERSLRDALATTHRMGLANIVAVAKHNLGLVVALRGQIDDGRALERDALRMVTAQGDKRIEIAARVYLALIELEAQNLAAAETEARAAIELAGNVRGLAAFAHGVLARVLIASNRGPEAIPHAEEAMNVLAVPPGVEEGEAFIRLTWTEALLAVGRTGEAKQASAIAVARLRERAAAVTDDALRKSFLEDIAEHARTLALDGELAGA